MKENNMNDMNDIVIAAKEYQSKLQDKINKHHYGLFFNINTDQVLLSKGKKFIKVGMARQGERMGSSYAFIALEDSQTKTLGIVKKGDLLKAASFNSPAKNARGNILTDMNTALNNSGPYGIET